jgi:hypothetical protein
MCQLRFVFLFWAAGAFAADGGDALGSARRLMDSGAPQLALNRVRQSQPRDVAALGWAEWETLRLNLLLRTSRLDEVLLRAAALPPGMSEVFLRESHKIAARAAIAAGRGEIARQFAARVLWQLRPPAGEERDIRLRVIESLAADKKGDDAFRSMLRFQQDYRPIGANTAAFFVETLLDLGMVTEAVNWLGSLDAAGAARQLLRLKTGLLAADAAITQARTILVKHNSRGYWRVIWQAALQKQDLVLQVEALENLLHLSDATSSRVLAAQSRALWQAYLDIAPAAGNHNRLLAGDDVGWADFAARRLGSNAPLARTFLAYLAYQGQIRETRHSAQRQLVTSLETHRIELTALRLFQYAHPVPEAIDGQTRYLLGAIAEKHNLPEIALHFWQDINVPSNVGLDEWKMRTAAVTLRAGNMNRNAAALKDVISAVNKLPAALLKRCVALAQDMLDAGSPDFARELFEALLPVVDASLGRTVFFGLGQVYDITGQPQTAADNFLRAALMTKRRAPDTLALQARQFAVLNLARAGNRNGARAQLEWLIKNSNNLAQIEWARRELKKL